MSVHKTKMNEYQKKVNDIIENLLKDKDSVLHFSNLSNKRYIEYKNYLIVLNYDIVNIINTHSCYDVMMEKDAMMFIVEKFDKELERRVRSLEFLKRKNLSSALDKLADNIKLTQNFSGDV
jgi:hypothetical protein